MNPENRWVKKSEAIPWYDIEQRYASLFPSNTGMPAKPLQTALGSLLIQKQYGYSDRELVEQIREPYIRPIVRGKAKSPTEFGAKLDMSIDENGIARLERLSFDAYNESDVLIGSIEKYFERAGHYPERVLVDQIYRNRRNRTFCRERGIRMSGPALGRPKRMTPEAHRQSYNDNVDRIEVERGFSLAKRCYGLGLIRTKLDTTTRSSIALSIISMNLDRLTAVNFVTMLISIFSRYVWQNNLPHKSIDSILVCDAAY